MKKSDVYEIVTTNLLTILESGVNPWKKTWKNVRDYGMPFNLAGKRNYSGANIMILGSQDVDCPAWVTFKQCKDLGGNVKKGAKSTIITFWMFKRVEDEKTGKEKTIPFLRYYRVFNVLRDCEGLEEKLKFLNMDEIRDSVPAEAINSYLEKESIPLSHGGNRAYYTPSRDAIQMPHEQAFDTSDHYQAVLAHEAIHSTGHSSRLNRLEKRAAFGSEDYGFEELIAETGSCLLCAEIGIEPDFDNSAAYLKNWAKSLKDNPKWFVLASGKASKAVDLVLGRTKEA